MIQEKHLNRTITGIRRTGNKVERAMDEDWVGQLRAQGRFAEVERMMETVARTGAICRSFMKYVESQDGL